MFLLFPPPVTFFSLAEGLSKDSNWTCRLQPISSLCSVLYSSGFQMIHPPLRTLIGWRRLDRGCGDSLLMSSLSSWTEGKTPSLFVKTPNVKKKKKRKSETMRGSLSPLGSCNFHHLTMKTHFGSFLTERLSQYKG